MAVRARPGQQSRPSGPLRDKIEVDIAADDYALDGGFICEIRTTGGSNQITYRTVGGDADITETVAVGDVIGVGPYAVLVAVVRGTSTVTGIWAGVP